GLPPRLTPSRCPGVHAAPFLGSCPLLLPTERATPAESRVIPASIPPARRGMSVAQCRQEGPAHGGTIAERDGCKGNARSHGRHDERDGADRAGRVPVDDVLAAGGRDGPRR